MNCGEVQEKLMGIARGFNDAAALDHVRECAECARALVNQRTLSAGLKSIASNETAEPSLALEAGLLAHFDRVRKPRRRFPLWLVPALAGAAAGILAWVFLAPAPRSVTRPVEPVRTVKAAPPPVSVAPKMPEASRSVALRLAKVPRRRVPPTKVEQAAAQPEQEAPFTAIPYAAPLLPTERAEVVRVNLSATALSSMGVPVWGADPGMRLNAELVVGENGLARAVRLVRSDGPE